MNILFITPSIPSRLHRIRAYTLITMLAKNHKVILLSLSHDRAMKIPQEIESVCTHSEVLYKSRARAMLDCLLYFWRPAEVAYCHSPEMNTRVRQLITKYSIDCIYVKRLRSVQYVSTVKTPIIVDSTDAMSLFYKKVGNHTPLFKKPFYYLEGLKYDAYEKKLSETFKHWIVCSPVDKNYLKDSLSDLVTIDIIPNSIDESYYTPQHINSHQHHIVFSGLMDKFVNVEAITWFTKNIFPGIKKQINDVKLFIVGPNPTNVVKRLASKNIVVTGEVNDIREYISKCEIVICPVKTGTGTRNKILQAWALGRAVVSTQEGAEGLDAVPEKNILIAHTPQEFEIMAVRLLNDTMLRNSLIEGGLTTIREKYSQTVVSLLLDDVIKKVNIKK
jgi:glycosyltransferase involved in cell wall biosynthesis